MNCVNVLHTSDWHLGKKLYKFDRTEEHEMFLDWIVKTIADEEINILLIAGDIFDVPTPPYNAQKMFYDFIFELEKFQDLTTIVIAGNHDSPQLLNIPKYFFEKTNCYVFPTINPQMSKNEIIIEHEGLKIGIKALPYFRNYELLNLLSNREPEKFFEEYFSTWSSNTSLDSKILVSHHGFGQYAAAGSEQAIHLSGMDYIPLSWVSKYFDYCALGHIHRKQTLKTDPYIIYPGSPIPLRFSETDKKFVSLYRISHNEKKQTFKQIPEFRKLIRVQGDHANYLEKLSQVLQELQDNQLEALLEIEVKLSEPKVGIADDIRKFIHNKNIELVSFKPIFSHLTAPERAVGKLDEFDIFNMFNQYYAKIFPESEEVPTSVLNEFKQLVEEVRDENS